MSTDDKVKKLYGKIQLTKKPEADGKDKLKELKKLVRELNKDGSIRDYVEKPAVQ